MGISESVTEVMERASAALLATSYFEVETLCVKAMELARRSRDFETMARIILPLQEARRQRRHMATDTGSVKVLVALPSESTVLESACYLLKPPLIAAEATSVRELAFAQQIPAAILTREPRTSTGKWPVVAVTTDRSFRAQIDAPRVNGTEVADGDAPDIGWFMLAVEAVGDAAIARLKTSDPAVFRVDDLWESMLCLPEHEKLHQRCIVECRLAMTEPRPDKLRRRGLFEDLSAF